MTTEHDHDAGSTADRDGEPAAGTVHDSSWSANLETPEYAEDPAAVVDGAVRAIERTAPGNHVNLVTHGSHGHPEGYLFEALQAAFGSTDVEWEYVDRCGCGGHVTRVSVD